MGASPDTGSGASSRFPLALETTLDQVSSTLTHRHTWFGAPVSLSSTRGMFRVVGPGTVTTLPLDTETIFVS